MTLQLQPVPGQRVPFVDGTGNITAAWFYWLKQLVDSGVNVLDASTTSLQSQLDDQAILNAFYQADK